MGTEKEKPPPRLTGRRLVMTTQLQLVCYDLILPPIAGNLAWRDIIFLNL